MVLNKNIASKVLMIRPIRFGFNEETADSNAFQNRSDTYTSEQLQEKALNEFNHFVQILEQNGIEVIVFDDTLTPFTPDSIFPNNWFSSDSNRLLLTYPMATKNRSLERRSDIIEKLRDSYGYELNSSLVTFESQNKFLEGTGSLLIDHASDTTFTAISPRTNVEVLEAYSAITGKKNISFKAFGPKGEEIYHTNVMLCIADEFALLGLETIALEDQKRVVLELEKLNKEIILLTNEQVYENFGGNMLQLQNNLGEKFLVMSSKAKNSLSRNQIEKIHSFENKIIDVPLDIIEMIGGGSARCMMAEIFTPSFNK